MSITQDYFNMKKILLFLVGIMLLWSCEHKINKGVVTNKYYVPSTSSIVMISTSKTVVPVTQIHPARFVVKVKDGDIEEDFIVSSKVYTTVQINDSINFNGKDL